MTEPDGGLPAPDDPDLFSVRDRVAIVTGASAGLGARFARVLAGRGAHVVAAARRLPKLEALATEYPNVMAVAADVTDEIDRARLVETALARFGRIDVLVNNAGGAGTTAALDESLVEARAILELNLIASYEMCKLVAAPMIEAGSGSIINIASVLGLGAAAPFSIGAYSASKGAIVNITRELGTQWARRGVRVNAIAPGFFPSEANEPLIEDDRSHAAVTRTTPMRRFGAPHELDGILLYLASDASSYCTGQTIAVDGGWTAR